MAIAGNEVMSSSPTVYKDENQKSERRSAPRDTLERVVLVYFGQDNWGKLVDLSESGMCLEFAQPPSVRDGVNFTFEAMGRVPDSFGEETISNSFQAAGDVRWTRDFERTAGVQFVSLPEKSREQIRKWLSFEVLATGPADTKTAQEAPVPLTEPHELAQAFSESLPAVREDEYELQLEAKSAGSGWEQLRDPSAALTERIFEAPAFDVDVGGEVIADEESEHAKTSDATPWLGRTLVIGVTLSLAAVVVIGSVRMILPRFARRVPAVDRPPISAAADGEFVSAQYDSAGGSHRPFLVEVLDANNRRWLLWFDDSNSKSAPTQAAYKSSQPFSPALGGGAGRPKQPAASPKPSTPHQFTLIAPKASRPRPNNAATNLPSFEAPVVRDELQPPLGTPIVSILSSPATPSPASGSASVGGQVQVARLQKSVSPVYPTIARTNHVGGDVALDALIDANGNVTELKVIFGPPILRQAAMDAVRQWKYDPARLNGRPVAIHLGVTVKFRVD
jgi:periplasmic protein TonB